MTDSLLYHKKANGKLLITGEYYVLDGATALACPSVYGQTLAVHRSETFSWKSFDYLNQLWIELNEKNSNSEAGKKLLEILISIGEFELKNKYQMTMDFPHEWGLGSSSTLIALLADYFSINPYELNNKIFHGSGYDIACAFSETPILYSNKDKISPEIKPAFIPEAIKPYCYFAYLNRKQDSREGINLYRNLGGNKSVIIHEISSITKELIEKQNLEDWIYLLGNHEEIISSSLSIPRAADTVLKGLPFFSKSLGAWGGDFVLILTDDSEVNVKNKLSDYGIETVFNYKEFLR
jgi:mevalonate kinase